MRTPTELRVRGPAQEAKGQALEWSVAVRLYRQKRAEQTGRILMMTLGNDWLLEKDGSGSAFVWGG